MHRVSSYAALVALLSLGTPVQAQWFNWVDETGVECGLINAENVSLVVSDQTGSLILLNGADRELVNTGVTEDGQVVIDDEYVGYIEYASDARDRMRVFWVTEIGSLYRLETDGEPVATETFPEEVTGNCDPCDGYWDDEDDCYVDAYQDEELTDTEAISEALVSGLCGLGSAGFMAALLISLTALRITRPRVWRGPALLIRK